MLSNVEAAENFRGLARTKARDFITKTVNPLLVDEQLAQGWEIAKRGKQTVQLRRAKVHNVRLEDRVWVLLYRMGFTHLSGQGGGSLSIAPRDPNSPKTQIDVVGIDEETALAIECKSAEKLSKRPQFAEELGKHSMVRAAFTAAVREQFATSTKRQVALAIFTSNINLNENDRKRAQEQNIVVFDDQDLTYYEALVAHLGSAARYQFLADMLPNKLVPGLQIRVPAVRVKMGGHNCYTFSISPEYLLKLAYVSHRAKGKASDVDTYQRMIRKSRLKSIQNYIDQNGIFPTNIVINLDKKPQFHRSGQETDSVENGTMGWLDLRPAYKSAWIIDGQHRLFAYSGHKSAAKASLAVLAFEGLPASKQAELFIDINSEQKNVKQSLLQELYAELHWNADEPEVRVGAILSKAIKSLDADPDSPFYRRILASDDIRDATRCISLTSIFRALEHSELFIAAMKKGGIIDYGPLWAGNDNEATRKRTVKLLMDWFDIIRASAPDWWDAGSGDGGGLSMNDGVTACIFVLRSVLQHLGDGGQNLKMLTTDELFERMKPYAEALGEYLGSLTYNERKQFRDLRGAQGQMMRTRRCQQAIHELIPAFLPAGLEEFMEVEEAQTNTRATGIIDRIETTVRNTVLEEIKREYGSEEAQWWALGIPRSVRLKVAQRHEEDDGTSGGRESYFDLLDLRKVVIQHWDSFEQILGQGKATSGRERRTAWINDVFEAKKVLAQASTGKSISLEELARLQSHDAWLTEQMDALDATETVATD